jgi:hypothetical protein
MTFIKSLVLAKFCGTCSKCLGAICRGDCIVQLDGGEWVHEGCDD